MEKRLGRKQSSSSPGTGLAEAMWKMAESRPSVDRAASAGFVLRELQGFCGPYLRNHFGWAVARLADGELAALADDAMQFTLEALCAGRLRNRPAGDGPARAWLRTCVRRFVSNELRRRLRETHEIPNVAVKRSLAGALDAADLTHFLCAVETELASIRRRRDFASQRLAIRCWLSDTVHPLALSGAPAELAHPASSALNRKRKQRGRAAARAAVAALAKKGRASARVLRVAELLQLDL